MAHLDLGVPNDILLRVTPPKVPRQFIARAHLEASHPLLDADAVIVQAPAGFGKTFLLAQWRREFLATGSVVAWVTAQAQDDDTRLLQCLAMSVRLAAARPTFGHTLMTGAGPTGLEGITTWLAEVAQAALNIVLVVDDAERLNEATRELLIYLLHNAPSNLRIVVSARSDCKLGVDDLLAYGSCVAIGPSALRFTLDETLRLVEERFKGRVDCDAAARLHDVTEGWPLGLQLAITMLTKSSDPMSEIAAMVSGSYSLHHDLMYQMLAKLDTTDMDFLRRVAILDHLYPDLCRALTQDDQADQRLARLCHETPILVSGEHGDWLRLHTLAKQALRDQGNGLLPLEQAQLHERASLWFAEHHQLELAAFHALKAGCDDQAYDLAERSLYDTLMTRGQQAQVLQWLDQMPETALHQRPRLLLAGAWSLALSERHAQARQSVERLLTGEQVSDALRCECAMIMGGAAIFSDDPDLFAQLHDPWASNPPLQDPLLLHVHANRSAYRALLAGEPALARMRQQQAPREGTTNAHKYLDLWGTQIMCQTYAWEGQVVLVEQLLRPTLARTEIELGRRHPVTCAMAALLATSVWHQGRTSEVPALLANRLDVIERSGRPDVVVWSYQTLVRVALAQNQEHRAMALLEALYALGVTRQLPRLCIVSLCDQVALHARSYHGESCRVLMDRIDTLMAEQPRQQGSLWFDNLAPLQATARGYAYLASRQWREAADALGHANTLAQGRKMGSLHIETLGLLAFARHQYVGHAEELLREALDLARVFGLARILVDAHPDMADWIQRSVIKPEVPAQSIAPVPPVGRPVPAKSVPATILTPKEREVLTLLGRNLSNKEIGLALQVGEGTVKWHVKNLFAKLDVGYRKQLVAKARLYGLID
jgi:LuxR family maltose regulon positive regulatory protein